MVLNSKVYIPKLTEQREILNILKSGDLNLMDPLFDSLRLFRKLEDDYSESEIAQLSVSFINPELYISDLIRNGVI